MKNLHAVTSTLKQQVSNHRYIDQVASYSPNFRAPKRSGSKQMKDAGATQSSARISGGAVLVGGKSPRHDSRFGGRRGSGDGDVYLPGTSAFQAPPCLKNLLKEHTQLKSHQTKKWLKKKVQFDKFKEPAPGEQDDGGDGAGPGGPAPFVKKQYLMSTQEIKQNEIIE